MDGAADRARQRAGRRRARDARPAGALDRTTCRLDEDRVTEHRVSHPSPTECGRRSLRWPARLPAGHRATRPPGRSCTRWEFADTEATSAVQMSNVVADDGGVDVLGVQSVEHSTAGARGELSEACRFVRMKLSQLRDVPSRLEEEMTEVRALDAFGRPLER